MSLKHDLQKLADRTGGRATRSARRTTAKQLAQFSGQYGIKDVKQIKPKTIERFIDSIRDDCGTRTLQNKMSHIREILREAGKGQLADEKIISNATLGIEGGSRIGTHQSVDDDRFSGMIEKLPADVKIAAELQRSLGLRLGEAVGAGSMDILQRLERDIERDYVKSVHITEQTKGGRPRDTSFSPAQYEKAREVISRAIKYLEENKREYLIQGKSDTYKSAYDRMSNSMRRVGGFVGKESSHSSRYSWARERLAEYQKDGLGTKEARERTAADLGHGSGRDRWVASVYVQK